MSITTQKKGSYREMTLAEFRQCAEHRAKATYRHPLI